MLVGDLLNEGTRGLSLLPTGSPHVLWALHGPHEAWMECEDHVGSVPTFLEL